MPSMFARSRESSAAAVSKTLRQLVDKGFVERSVGTADGRQRKYQLTAKGKRTMSRLRQRREEAIRQVWMQIDDASLRSFIGFSEKLAAGLSTLLGREPRPSL